MTASVCMSDDCVDDSRSGDEEATCSLKADDRSSRAAGIDVERDDTAESSRQRSSREAGMQRRNLMHKNDDRHHNTGQQQTAKPTRANNETHHTTTVDHTPVRTVAIQHNRNTPTLTLKARLSVALHTSDRTAEPLTTVEVCKEG